MLVEKVIWTTLPAGLDAEGRLRLSVHVAPRLTTDDGDPSERTLDESGAFINWPDAMARMEFEVQVTDQLGGAVGGHGAQAADAGPDAELWKIVFPHDTLVRPHAFEDHAKRNVHVFPVRDVLSVVETAYGALAASGPDLPAVADPTGPLAVFGALDGLTDRLRDSNSYWDELNRAREKADGSEVEDGVVVHENHATPGLPQEQQAAQAALTEAARFYYRPGNRNPYLPDDYVEPAPELPRYDFHEIVSLLADHPTLLRRLGVVIDLVVDLPDPVAALPSHGLIRVVPHGDLPEDPPSAPWTNYELDDEWFGARPTRGGHMERGLVNLTPELWDLFQVDVDGAALQAVGFGTTLGAMLDPALNGPDTPIETGASALRSTGLALARQGRGDQLLEDLVDRRAKNAAIEAGDADHVALDAEDLVRGYRVDVWDDAASEGPRWHSLHARVTEHHVDGLGEPIVMHDEGYLKATAASSERQDHPNPSDDLYLHETVAAWEGWSLAAPRPGKRIVEPGEGDDGTSVARYDPSVGQATAIRSEVAVEPGTLPRIRLGHTYRLRMRTVDLAGNSRAFSPEDYHVGSDSLASDAEMYLRFEPVPSPTILRRHLDTEGESLEHLVIRSDLDTAAADYINSAGIKEALEQAGVEHTYAAESQRHLAPPKGSVAMAEQDGRLDAAFGGTPAQMATALRVALREEGTFLDATIVDTATGQKTINQSTTLTHPSGLDLPTEEQRGAGLGPENPGAYAYHPDDSVVLPYLPDPLAVGVAVVGYDRAGTELFAHIEPFPGTWPDLGPFRLRLAEGPIDIGFSDGTIQVSLPQAEVVHAHLSSVFPEDRLDHFAIWDWTPQPARTAALKQAMVKGRHWMLTPFRRLTFTHAVQRPLAVPDMSKVVIARQLGRTYAEFRGPILNHAKSTGRIDVMASWTEDVDLLTDDAPQMRATGNAVAHSAHAFGFDLEPHEDAAEVARSGVGRVPRHEFGDTKHRRILYHSVATTRFGEFFARPIADNPALTQRVEDPMIDESTPKPMLVHHVPSSARPAMPEPLYVLPTFRWKADDEGSVRTHVRRGKAVRVWLRRPWFSSGDDEQLGVVLQPGVRLPGRWSRPDRLLEVERSLLATRARPIVSRRALRPAPPPRPSTPRSPMSRASGPGAARLAESTASFGASAINLDPVVALPQVPTDAEIDAMLQPYITQWGSDPVWDSRLPLLPPTVADFPRHVSYGTGLTLEELPAAARVVVAGHEVHYDTDRKLWYCDIEIENGDAYYPFVRLALARYQPYSVPNAHLSRVMMTDFIQLAPDRTAQVEPARGGYGITVSGYAGRNAVPDAVPSFLVELQPSPRPRPNTEMRVALEQRSQAIPGDLGWERVGAETTLSAEVSGWFVRWSGIVAVGPAPKGLDRRLLITEVETHLRDLAPGDPPYSTGPRDFVRERVVYADAFEL
jgi:hypothetical protein